MRNEKQKDWCASGWRNDAKRKTARHMANDKMTMGHEDHEDIAQRSVWLEHNDRIKLKQNTPIYQRLHQLESYEIKFSH